MRPYQEEIREGICNHFQISDSQVNVLKEGYCGSGVYALKEASLSIQGSSKVSIIVGLNVISVKATAVSRKNACTLTTPKPFGVDRTGFVRVEGVVSLLSTSDEFASAHSLPNLGKVRGVTAGNYSEEASQLSVETGKKVTAQAVAMREALSRAGMSAEEVSFIDLHGSGTVAGDLEECAAVGDVFGGRGKEEGEGGRGRELYVGTMSGVVGNTEVVSGLLSVVKVIHVLVSQTVPGMIGRKGEGEEGKEEEEEFVFDKECDLSSIHGVVAPLHTVKVDFMSGKRNADGSPPSSSLFGSVNGYGLEGFSVNAIVEVDEEVQSGWSSYLGGRGGQEAWVFCSNNVYVASPSVEELQHLSFSALGSVSPFSLHLGEGVQVVWKEAVDLRYVGDLSHAISLLPSKEGESLPHIVVAQERGVGLNQKACVCVERKQWSGEAGAVEEEIREKGGEVVGSVAFEKESGLLTFSYVVDGFGGEEEDGEEEGEEEEEEE